MVQGSLKLSSRPSQLKRTCKSSGKSAKITKREQKSKQTKKGNPLQLPKQQHAFREQALEERALSKAIDKANEQKVAAKLLQGGGKLKNAELLQKGKVLNKELRRAQVKKKLSRVEEKLAALEERAEAGGLI